MQSMQFNVKITFKLQKSHAPTHRLTWYSLSYHFSILTQQILVGVLNNIWYVLITQENVPSNVNIASELLFNAPIIWNIYDGIQASENMRACTVRNDFRRLMIWNFIAILFTQVILWTDFCLFCLRLIVFVVSFAQVINHLNVMYVIVHLLSQAHYEFIGWEYTNKRL